MRASIPATALSAMVLAMALAVVEARAIDGNGAVLAFSFEKTEGGIVRDESPAGNDGTLIDNAAIVGGGKFGRTLDLDVLADSILSDEPSGQFMTSGLETDSYGEFFRYKWIAFARRLQSGQSLSPSIREGCKSFHLTRAIIESLRNGAR